MPKIVAKKEDWIKLGYGLFSEQGVSGIIVEKMAKTLKINKSSFYWHFKTKNDFIDELIQYWIDLETERIIRTTDSIKAGLEKFKSHINLIYKQDLYWDFNFFLKQYARKEKRIQAIIDKVDTQRLMFAQNLLEEMGYSEEDANIKAKVLHKHYIGYHDTLRNKKQSADYQKELKKELNQIIKY